MNSQPFVIERVFDAPITKVWDALTKNEQIKKWYFQLVDFKPVVGFEFKFTAKNEQNVEFIHLCKVTEVIDGKKLAYSWRYKGYSGNSIVTFELFPEGNKTKLKLTHSGLETLEAASPDFARKNFEKGWTAILDKSLKGFVEAKSVQV